MNRTFFALAAILLLTTQVFAQKTFNPTPKNGIVSNPTIQATDTLFGDFFSGTPAIYQSQSIMPGYASGNNTFGDLAKVQVFSLDTISAVEGAIIWMGYKNHTSGNPNSNVNINLYDLKSTATGQGATALKLSPDSIIRTKSVLLSDIDTSSVYENGANVVIFDTPAYFDTLFAIGFDFSGLNQGDTIACYTTTNGDADSTESAWEQVADSSWFTMLRNWGLDIDFAIFPIIDGTLTSINTKPVYNTIIYPNPAIDVVTIAVTGNKPLNIGIIDSNGKAIASYNNVSSHISVNGMAKGIYYIVVDSGQRRGYAQKFIIQ